MTRTWFAAIAVIVAFPLAPLRCRAQLCTPHWSDEFPAAPAAPNVFAILDMGQGPCLYCASSEVLRWTGEHWVTLGTPMTGVWALAVYDDGTGPALYAGGYLTPSSTYSYGLIVKRNGSSWVEVARFSQSVFTLLAHDDGTGLALFAGGAFSGLTAGTTSIPARTIARLRAGQWSDLGDGPSSAPPRSSLEVAALKVHDEGTGPALYVGGAFQAVGGIPAGSIARWNGSAWSPVGGGVSAGVTSTAIITLASMLDGGSPTLCAGGRFTLAEGAPARNVARWDGSHWLPFGAGLGTSDGSDYVMSLTVYDDGTGSHLHAGGSFASRVAWWDGGTWVSLPSVPDGPIRALAGFEYGTGSALWAGGQFGTVGGLTMPGVAVWHHGAWVPPLSGGLSGYGVSRLRTLNDGSGPALYASTSCSIIGAQPALSRTLKRSGTNWTPLNANMGSSISIYSVSDFAMYDNGSGPALHAAPVGLTLSGGIPFVGVARWDGAQWVQAGNAFDGNITALQPASFGGQSMLYAAGNFTGAGGVAATGIASFDGDGWLPVGSYSTLVGGINALCGFDAGSGPSLYVGGAFAGGSMGNNLNRIARWDGATWHALTPGISHTSGYPYINDLTVFDDGRGPALYVAGRFTSPGNYVARWNGSAWEPLGIGVSDWVRALAVMDDGRGPALFAGGDFAIAGGAPAGHIARWDGHQWSALGSGVDGQVLTLTAYDDGRGPSLWVGGTFSQAGGFSSPFLARWTGCRGCYANCDGSTTPPVLGIPDFICFIDHFAAGDPAANCDMSTTPPMLNVGDFVCFLNRFAHGCP